MKKKLSITSLLSVVIAVFNGQYSKELVKTVNADKKIAREC